MFLYVKTSFPTGENISPLVETLILSGTGLEPRTTCS